MPDYNDLSDLPDQGSNDDLSDLPDQGTFDEQPQHDESFLGNLFSWPNAVRMGSAIGGDAAAAASLPWAVAAAPETFGASLLIPPGLKFLGGFGGETAGRYMEGQDFNPYISSLEGGINTFMPGPHLPGEGAGIAELAKYGIKSAGYGAGQGLIGSVPRHMAATGSIYDPEKGLNLPSLSEVAGQTLGGAVAGGVVGTALGGAHLGYGRLRGEAPPTDSGFVPPGQLPEERAFLERNPPVEPTQQELDFNAPLQGDLPFGSYRGESGRFTNQGPGYKGPYHPGILEPIPQSFDFGEPDATPPPAAPAPPSPPPTAGGVGPTNQINFTQPNVIPEGTTLSSNQQVVTITSPDAATVAYWRNLGYVPVPGLRSAEGYPQLVRGDVAPLYVTGDKRAPTTPPVQTAPQQPIVPQGRPEVPGPVGSEQVAAGETVPIPNEKVTTSLVQNMQANGYVVIGKDSVSTIFKKFVGGSEGGFDFTEIWQNLKRILGRDPTMDELYRARDQQRPNEEPSPFGNTPSNIMPGEQTGRVAPFPSAGDTINQQNTPPPQEPRVGESIPPEPEGARPPDNPYDRPYNPEEHGQPWYWKYGSGLLSNWPPTSLESVIDQIPDADLSVRLGQSTDTNEINTIIAEMQKRGMATTEPPQPPDPLHTKAANALFSLAHNLGVNPDDYSSLGELAHDLSVHFPQQWQQFLDSINAPSQGPIDMSQWPPGGPFVSPVHQGPQVMNEPRLPGLGPMGEGAPPNRVAPGMEIPPQGGLDVGGMRQQSLFPPEPPNPRIMDPRMADRVDAGYGGPRVFDYTQAPNQQGQMELPWARGENPLIIDADAAARERQAAADRFRKPQGDVYQQLSMEGQMKDAEIAAYLRGEDGTPPESIDLSQYGPDRLEGRRQTFNPPERGTSNAFDPQALRDYLTRKYGRPPSDTELVEAMMRQSASDEAPPGLEPPVSARPSALDEVRARLQRDIENPPPPRQRTIEDTLDDLESELNQGKSGEQYIGEARDRIESATDIKTALENMNLMSALAGNTEDPRLKAIGEALHTHANKKYYQLVHNRPPIDAQEAVMDTSRVYEMAQELAKNGKVNDADRNVANMMGRLKDKFPELRQKLSNIWATWKESNLTDSADKFGHLAGNPDEYYRAHNPDLYDTAGNPKPVPPISGTLGDTIDKIVKLTKDGKDTTPSFERLMDKYENQIAKNTGKNTEGKSLARVYHEDIEARLTEARRNDASPEEIDILRELVEISRRHMVSEEGISNQNIEVKQQPNGRNWGVYIDGELHEGYFSREAAERGAENYRRDIDPSYKTPLDIEWEKVIRGMDDAELKRRRDILTNREDYENPDIGPAIKAIDAELARRGSRIQQDAPGTPRPEGAFTDQQYEDLHSHLWNQAKDLTPLHDTARRLGLDPANYATPGELSRAISQVNRRGQTSSLAKSDPMATNYIENIQTMGPQKTFEMNHKVVEAQHLILRSMENDLTPKEIRRFHELVQFIKRDSSLSKAQQQSFDFESYKLPDGTIIKTDATATKSQPTIDFQLKDGTMVKAIRVAKNFLSDETGAMPIPEWAKKLTGQGTPPTEAQKAAQETHWVREAMALPTNATTMLDLSAPGRQGLSMILTPEFWKATVKMFGALHYGTYKAIDAELRAKPLMTRKIDLNTGKEIPSFGEQIGTKLFSPASEPGPHAEMTASRWLEVGIGKDPISLAWKHTIGYPIRATNRAFITFLNHLNVNRTEKLLNLARDMSVRGLDTGRTAMPGVLGGVHLPGGGNIGFTQKVSPTEAMNMNPYHNLPLAKEIAEFVNAATGHATAKGGFSLENAVSKIGPVLFSPGLLNSRIRMLNPVTYVMASPFVRKQYAKAAISTAAAWFVSTQLLKKAAGPDAQVSDDITSADFGKVRIGDARLDLGGGFLQFAVAYGRVYAGGATSSASGEFHRFGSGYQAQTQEDMTERFLVNKLNPIAKFAWDVASASEYNPVHMGDRTMQLFVPLFAQDLMEIGRTNPELLPMFGTAALFGGGSQIYSKGESVSKFIDPENDWNVTGGGMRDLMPWNWNSDQAPRNFPWSQPE